MTNPPAALPFGQEVNAETDLRVQRAPAECRTLGPKGERETLDGEAVRLLSSCLRRLLDHSWVFTNTSVRLLTVWQSHGN